MPSLPLNPPAWLAWAWHWIAVGASSCTVVAWLCGHGTQAWSRKHRKDKPVFKRALVGLEFGASFTLIALASYACARIATSVAWALIVLTRALAVHTNFSESITASLSSLSRELIGSKAHTVTACDDLAAIALVVLLLWFLVLLVEQLYRWLTSVLQI
jgi:F0F1-type ATP synthase membrane subunit c/vacuolar-type H+-ATPase subunit K